MSNIKFSYEGSIEDLRDLLCHHHKTSLEGGGIMFTVKADNPDVAYKITLPTVTDSEGNKRPSTTDDFDFTVDSSNPSAVEIVPDDDNDPTTGSVKFGGPDTDGNPNLGAVTVMGINKATGKGFSFGAQFTVTAGDPADIQGGDIAFAGLTEDAQPA